MKIIHFPVCKIEFTRFLKAERQASSESNGSAGVATPFMTAIRLIQVMSNATRHPGIDRNRTDRYFYEL
jgi:hypothetical protein